MARAASPMIRTIPIIARPARSDGFNLGLEIPGARTVARSPTVVAATLAAVFLLASAALSLYLAQVSSIATAGYQLSQLEAERKEWVARNGQLELELAKRHSLVWSEIQAHQRLGMVQADKPTYVAVTAPPLRASNCASGSSCGVQTASGAILASQARESRPRPGNPMFALHDLLSWLSVASGHGA